MSLLLALLACAASPKPADTAADTGESDPSDSAGTDTAPDTGGDTGRDTGGDTGGAPVYTGGAGDATVATETTRVAGADVTWYRPTRGGPLPVVLLANKCDLPNHQGPNKEQLDAFCKEHGFVRWYETSAKENINIEESVKGLVSSILEHSDALGAQKETKEGKGVSMSLAGEAPKKKEGGCC